MSISDSQESEEREPVGVVIDFGAVDADAINSVVVSPPFSRSMTSQMSTMSLQSFCTTFGLLRDFLKFKIRFDKLRLSHSEMSICLAVRNCSLVYEFRRTVFKSCRLRLSY